MGSQTSARRSVSQTQQSSVIISSVYLFTSGTPEVCQLPAGMAEKNELVLYPLYQVCNTKKTI